MSQGIVLARHGATLMTCVICKRPTTPEQIVPTGPKDGLCLECWVKAGDVRGWVRELMMGNVAPVRVVMEMLIQPHLGERGQDGNPIRLLLRLLHEHERMRFCVREMLLLDREERSELPPQCCYCGATDKEGEESLVPDEPTDGLPRIWHCADLAACDQRCAAQIAQMVGERMRAAMEARKQAAGIVTQ